MLVLSSISYLYYNIQKAAEHTYTPIKGKVVESAINNNDKQPFSLLLLGIDTGDYGRQDRQRQVIMGMIEKIKKIDTLTNYKNILSIMQNNLKTDLKWKGIQNFFLNYKSPLNQISSVQLQGRSFTG